MTDKSNKQWAAAIALLIGVGMFFASCVLALRLIVELLVS